MPALQLYHLLATQVQAKKPLSGYFSRVHNLQTGAMFFHYSALRVLESFLSILPLLASGGQSSCWISTLAPSPIALPLASHDPSTFLLS